MTSGTGTYTYTDNFISVIRQLYSKEMIKICLLVGRMDEWAEMMVGSWPHRRQEEEAHEAGY